MNKWAVAVMNKRSGANRWWIWGAVVAVGVLGSDLSLALEPRASGFTGMGSIINTRHNLSLSTNSYGRTSSVMSTTMNDYGEVCVYCHTPHGSNENLDAPLWNRTFLSSTTYTTYSDLGSSSITQSISQPGINSLTCLSCHDGTIAVDSIVNMPGSGTNRYRDSAKTSQQEDFLDGWSQGNIQHRKLGGASLSCMVCHYGADVETGFAADFAAAAIGTDLTNDHPVGIVLPEERIGVDFTDPSVRGTKMAFYDGDGDSHADSNEIRFYKTSGTYKVECASCHDPHGVESAGEGSALNPTFLRVTNQNSTVCLTCHEK